MVSMNPIQILAQNDGPSFASQPTAASTAASTAATGADASGAAAPARSGTADFIFLAGLAVFAFMIINMFLTSRRDQKRRAEMMSGIKKNDQVRTTGGILGSVVEVKPDVVILKVDEGSNTKITVVRTAIETVIKESTTGTA